MIAHHHRRLGNRSLAEEYYRAAANRAIETKNSNGIFVLAEFLSEEYSQPKAIEYLAGALHSCLGHEVASEIANKLGELYETEGKHELSVLLFQYSVINNPSNHHNRFSVAHKLSNSLDEELLAYAHYDNLSKTAPSTGYAVNNLAMSYDSQVAPSAYVDAMREAAKHTKIYSLSSLAIHAADAGFINEADAFLDQITALELKECDEQDAAQYRQAQETIAKIQSKSQKYVEKKFEASLKSARFHTAAAKYSVENISKIQNYNFSGEWQSDDQVSFMKIEKTSNLLNQFSISITSPSLSSESLTEGDCSHEDVLLVGKLKEKKAHQPKTILGMSAAKDWRIKVAAIGEATLSLLAISKSDENDVVRLNFVRKKS